MWRVDSVKGRRQTVVALVVGQCVPLVGVGVELERMVVDKVLLLVCCGSGLINQLRKQISCCHRGLHGRGQGSTSKSTSTNVVVVPE
jgi:hypothetical protein